jgi:hypothetical protein
VLAYALAHPQNMSFTICVICQDHTLLESKQALRFERYVGFLKNRNLQYCLVLTGKLGTEEEVIPAVCSRLTLFFKKKPGQAPDTKRFEARPNTVLQVRFRS